MSKDTQGRIGRVLENTGFIVAILIGLLYGLNEAGVLGCDCVRGFPWGLALMLFALVLPKTIGRATAGKLWEKILPGGGTSG